jgi:hypothetical protein
MAVTVIEQCASQNLTTLATIKSELGIADTTDDDVLLGMIDRASSAIARECGRVFGVETVYETLKGTNSQILGLTRAPIVSVTSVLEDSEPFTDYSVEDAEAGALYRVAGWRRGLGIFGNGGFGGGGWDSIAYASGYILPGGQAEQRFIVTYRAGYVLPPFADPFVLPGPDDAQPLPGAIEQACLETIKTWYAQRDGVVADASAVRVGSLQVQYAGNSLSDQAARLGLPANVIGMLRQYRRIL